MSKFEIGDRVKAIQTRAGKSPTSIVAGSVYVVRSIDEMGHPILAHEPDWEEHGWSAGNFELYAKAGKFVAGDRIVCVETYEPHRTKGAMYTALKPSEYDPSCVIILGDNGHETSHFVTYFRLATPEEIAAADLAAPKFSEVNPSIVIEPKPVVERAEIPASEFDFSTIKAGDEIVVRLVVDQDGMDFDKEISFPRGYVEPSQIVSVIPAPKPKTLRERAIEAANKAWNDASFSDRTIERLALAVLAEVERGEP